MSRHTKTLVPLVLALGISSCGSDNGTPLSSAEGFRYRVTITNLTAGQPLSPAALVVHAEGWQGLALGEPASTELERLAEGGDNQAFITAAQTHEAVFATASGPDAIAPGGTDQITIEVSAPADSERRLTWASMAINTNDGLAALDGIDLTELAVGAEASYLALSYDAGTEANTESADTVPGPAASGLAEGFNAARDDVRDAIYLHPGVVTAADGLSSSTLGGEARWDHPIARVRIERLE